MGSREQWVVTEAASLEQALLVERVRNQALHVAGATVPAAIEKLTPEELRALLQTQAQKG